MQPTKISKKIFIEGLSGTFEKKCSNCKWEYPMGKYETGCNRKNKYKNHCSVSAPNAWKWNGK